MPAMSPTMTEGNIASWKVKEGDSFSTGDVLLEIETDKATMDVEAQDDGIMAKIFAPDGSKNVQVGTRIAVVADEGDDISSLEMPPEDVKKVEEEQTESKRESKPAPRPEPTLTPTDSRSPPLAPASSPRGPGQNTKYPLYPSVTALVHENHLSDSDVAKIPATGPQNRLLKGDVLAYLGAIAPDYSSKESKRIEHMSHLDLSNIKILPPAGKPAAPTKEQALAPTPIPSVATDVSIPISLAEVLKVQKRIQDSLGVTMPLSTFLARAVDIANDDLPVPKGTQPSADELFDALVGLDTISNTSRGSYIPQIAALPVPASATKGLASRPKMYGRQADIIDILSGKASSTTVARPTIASSASATASPLRSGSTNLFTLTVPVGEEKRAKTFLERMKTVLQVEPGRLVL
jgi:pyruvate/2-oxoglutarate dehydrogenase complex dihydrolipoamide acyltransferase (E2) component